MNRSRELPPALLTVTLLLITGTAPSTAHPIHPPPANQTRSVQVPMREGRRMTMRIVKPARVAPDQQTEPLEKGTQPKIEPANRVVLSAKVVDAESGRILPFRVHIEDAEGNYFPPTGHFDIELPDWNSNNVSYEPDTNNDGYDWAMIPKGRFTAELPAIDGLRVRVSHGLEYPLTTFPLDLAGQQGKSVERRFMLKRGINMREKGWMAVDTHVHNLTPQGAIRQMPVEAIDYVNLMFIGPGHPLLRRKYITGKPSLVSTDDHIVYVSQEVRDANQGHMTLIGLRMPIDPIRVYTGVELSKRLKRLPNEPLNWEVYDRMHAQGGLAYHAHFLYWPGYGSAVGAAIDKLDGLEWLRTDTFFRGDRSRQNIEVPGFGRRASAVLWYDILNCGIQMPLIGGTDKMNAGRVVGGSSRTYVKVDQWNHEGFMGGLKTGRTFVTNGPLLSLSAGGQTIGSEIELEGDGPHLVKLKADCFTQVPIRFLEVLVNGKVARHVHVADDQKEISLKMDLPITESCWIALRARHDQPNVDNWHRGITAAHTSPIYVTLNGRKPAVKASAQYMVARLDETIRWGEEDAFWSHDLRRQEAINSFRAAREVYVAALKRAGK